MRRQPQLNRRAVRSAICRRLAGYDHAQHEDDEAGERVISIPNVQLPPCPIPKTVILIAVGVRVALT
jgi:hypothetical protein